VRTYYCYIKRTRAGEMSKSGQAGETPQPPKKHNNIIESATPDHIHVRLRKTKANNIMEIIIIIGTTHKRASELEFA